MNGEERDNDPNPVAWTVRRLCPLYAVCVAIGAALIVWSIVREDVVRVLFAVVWTAYAFALFRAGRPRRRR